MRSEKVIAIGAGAQNNQQAEELPDHTSKSHVAVVIDNGLDYAGISGILHKDKRPARVISRSIVNRKVEL